MTTKPKTAAAKPACSEQDQSLAQLIDQRRDLAAQLAGKDLEIAMALGDRDGAQKHLREMEAQVTARKAARSEGCYFMEQGDLARQRMESEAV